MVGAEDALADGEGAFEEGAGGGRVALVANDGTQVIEAGSRWSIPFALIHKLERYLVAVQAHRQTVSEPAGFDLGRVHSPPAPV